MKSAQVDFNKNFLPGLTSFSISTVITTWDWSTKSIGFLRVTSLMVGEISTVIPGQTFIISKGPEFYI